MMSSTRNDNSAMTSSSIDLDNNHQINSELSSLQWGLVIGAVCIFLTLFTICFCIHLKQNQAQNGVARLNTRPNDQTSDSIDAPIILGIFSALTREEKVEILNNLIAKSSSYYGQWGKSHSNYSCNELEYLEEGNHDCSKIDSCSYVSFPSCSICLDTYSDESIVVKTKVSVTLNSKIYNSLRLDDLPIATYRYVDKKKCAHLFHKDCLLQWILKRRSCPYCRTNIISVHDIKVQLIHLETKVLPYH